MALKGWWCKDKFRLAKLVLDLNPGFLLVFASWSWKFASQTLLKTTTPISRLRGRFYDYRGIKVMPTFHPAYLLRSPDDKRLVWEDVKQIMSAIK